MCGHQKTVFEMTAADLDARWETTVPLIHLAAAMTAWSSLAHSVLMCNIRCLRSSLYTFSYTVPHTLWLTGFKSGHVVKAKLILTFLFLLAKTAFFNDITITSSLRSVAQVLMGFFFTIFQSPRMSLWFVPKIMKSCLNLSKLWSKYCRPPFIRTRYCTRIIHAKNNLRRISRIGKSNQIAQEIGSKTNHQIQTEKCY